MATRRPRARFGSGISDAADDSAVIVERLSKRYPTRPVNLFPPVASIFDYDLNPFGRKRRAAEEAAEADAAAVTTARPPTRRPVPIPEREERLDEEDDFEDDDDDDDDDDEDVPGEGGKRTPWRPGEMFWALKDISFRVPSGGALGVLGGPDSGKTTLLSILGGQAFPTEGRVLVRDPVSPIPIALAKSLGLTNRGTFKFDLVFAARLLGIAPSRVTPYRAEIEAMAAPLWTEEEEPAPGAFLRMAMATAVLVPMRVMLIEEAPNIDPVFFEQIVELIPERLRQGSSLVLASRTPDLIARLCDQAIVLEDGVVVQEGGVEEVIGGYGGSARKARGGGGNGGPGGSPGGLAPSRHLSDQRELQIPAVIRAFNATAALLSATLSTPAGHSKRLDGAAEEVSIEIGFETAEPDVEAHCGVVFSPRQGDGPGIRLELPEPLRFVDPRTYRLVARTPPGVLRAGAYDVRADAVVAEPAGGEATVIARYIGRVRILGDEEDPAADDVGESAVTHWDGSLVGRVDAEWSVE